MRTAQFAAIAGTVGQLCGGYPAIAAERIATDEYGVSVELPEGHQTCWVESGTHPHGVGTRLDGAACQTQSGPALRMWSDYNAAFLTDARDIVRYEDRCTGGKAAWAKGQWRNSVGGLKTAMCRYEDSEGVHLVLVGQSNRRWEGFGAQEDKFPFIFHTVRLDTNKARYERDLATFRSFVKSIRMTTPGR